MQGADHSEGERLVESERIADRESKLADFEVGGAANRDRLRNRLRIAQTHNGEIIVWRRADDIRRDGLAAGKPDHHLRRAVDPWLLVTMLPAASQTNPVPDCTPALSSSKT